MTNGNPYDDRSQAKKLILSNYLSFTHRLAKDLGYYFILIFRAIGRLFLEAIGKG